MLISTCQIKLKLDLRCDTWSVFSASKVYTHVSDRAHKSHFMLGQPEIDWSSLLLAQTSGGGRKKKKKRNKSKKNRQDG